MYHESLQQWRLQRGPTSCTSCSRTSARSRRHYSHQMPRHPRRSLLRTLGGWPPAPSFFSVPTAKHRSATHRARPSSLAAGRVRRAFTETMTPSQRHFRRSSISCAQPIRRRRCGRTRHWWSWRAPDRADRRPTRGRWRGQAACRRHRARRAMAAAAAAASLARGRPSDSAAWTHAHHR